MKRFMTIGWLLALALALCLSACQGEKAPSPATTQDPTADPATTVAGKTDPPATKEPGTDHVTAAPPQTDPVTDAPVTTDPPQTQPPTLSPGEEALFSVRQSMEGTTQIMAAAYLGMVWDLTPDGILSWINEQYPAFASEMAFLAEMKPEQFIGGQTGEVYLLILGDEAGSLAVNGLSAGSEELVWDQVLYRSEGGEPILLICNSGDYKPDAQIVYTAPGKESLTWFPELTPYLFLSPALNDDYAHLILDLTPYREGMQKEYAVAMENGFTVPTADQLMNTRWECAYYINEIDCYTYSMFIGESGLTITWTDGYDAEPHMLENCRYKIEMVNGKCRFTIDTGEFAGERIYHLLLSEEYDLLQTYVDLERETVFRDVEPLTRMMYQQAE